MNGKDVMKSLLKIVKNKHLGYALVAVLIASVLWIYVAQSQNPMEERLFEIPLEYNNLPANMAVVDRLDTVSVRVQGYTRIVENLDTRDITASLDLSDANVGQYVSKINIELPSNVQLISVTPVDVEVNIQELRSVEVAVEVNTDDVTVAEGYTLLTPIIDISAVKVSGAEENVALIDHAEVKIPAGTLSESYNGTLAVSVYDENGNSLDDLVEIVPDAIDVLLPVVTEEPSKVAPISAALVGEPADGYTISRILISPNVVTVYGSQYLLDNIDYVLTESIDITNARGNVSANVGLISGEGIRLDSEENVDVVVFIEREDTVTFDNVQVKLINSDASRSYSLSRETVSVTVRGPLSGISALSANSISVEADVSGLETGTHQVHLTYTIPGTSYVESISPDTVTVRVR